MNDNSSTEPDNEFLDRLAAEAIRARVKEQLSLEVVQRDWVRLMNLAYGEIPYPKSLRATYERHTLTTLHAISSARDRLEVRSHSSPTKEDL